MPNEAKVRIKRVVVCFIWSRIYRRWLWNDFYQEYDIVEKVIGWRTARKRDRCGCKQCITPCFTILGIEFD